MFTMIFTEGAPTKQFETAIEQEMAKSLSHFEKEVLKIRTGRAHPSMVSDIKLAVASYGGSFMALKDLAAISTPEPQLLVIQPWDKSLIADIEKAITTSDLGINPINDGNVIRLPLPKMSGSRREELSKILAKRLEECRVGMRTVRKDVHNLLRTAEKDRKISEDYGKRLSTALQKVTDMMIEKADQMAAKKESEISSL